MEGISSRPAQHAAIALRCTTAALAPLGPPVTASLASVTATASGVSGGPVTVKLLPSAAADRAVLMSHLTKVLLYQRPSAEKVLTPLQAAAAAGQQVRGWVGCFVSVKQSIFAKL